MAVLNAVERLGVTRKTVPLGLAVGVAAGLMVAVGAGMYLVAAIIGVAVLAATADRPDLAVSALIIVVPFYGSTDLAPHVTLTRVLALWALVVVASATEGQKSRSQQLSLVSRESDPVRGPLTAWVGVFLAIMLVAALRSPSLRQGVQSWLDEFLLPLGALLVFSRYRWSRRQIDLVVTVYMLCCCLWSLLSLYEFLARRSLFTPDHTLPWLTGSVGRTGGPFINPAFLGTAVGIGLALALVWVFRTGFARRVAFVCIPMSAIGLTVCLTRGSWLGAAVGVVLALLLPKKRRVGMILLIVCGLALGVLVLVSVMGSGFLANRLDSSSEVFNRIVVQNAALRVVFEHPLFGIGSDRFGSLVSQNLQSVGSISGSFGVDVFVPHNSVLGSTVDGGFGAGFSLVVVIGLLVAAGRRRLVGASQRYLGIAMLACVAVLAMNAMFIDMSLGSKVTMLAFTLIGMFMSTVSRPEPDADHSDPIGS